ncbi:MAG: trehalose-6-phosphate synthase, partial [Elusimicrobia bacterium]|nr:trehalose-6-phosphate synthase [Elusimicrobiota bacterium]
MRLTLRLAASLIAAATLVAGGSTWLQTRLQRQRLIEDMNRRGEAVGEGLIEAAGDALERRDAKDLQRFVGRVRRLERLVGVALYVDPKAPLAATQGFDPPVDAKGAVGAAFASGEAQSGLGGGLHWSVQPYVDDGAIKGAALVVHDASYLDARVAETWRRSFLRLLIDALLIAAISLWLVRWNILAPMTQMADWLKVVRAGGEAPPPSDAAARLFEPLAKEVSRLGETLTAARSAAEEEARLRVAGDAVWTPQRLKEHVRAALGGRPIFIVANREPYMHVRRGRKIEVLTPASGLVTGIEPILLACDGTWVAAGAGDADREVVDGNDRLRVPPDHPQYTLRLVWLSKEEEEGYYYGFSNEGLWPLCHIAHTRPMFRPEDWAMYRAVNVKFAQALLQELEGTEEPCVLIQDYHYALLPRLIKEARPDARVGLFWHIPWPNPEAFGICPWQREILDGMLGADVLGFHIQFHCNNFLETVDRALESRIEWDSFTVNRKGHATAVRPFPISVAVPDPGSLGPEPDREALLKDLGVKADFIAVGVDRVDYTKGIVERFRAVERFLEKEPSYRGRFTLVQLAAPSRTHIKRYNDLNVELESEAERINWRFATKEWRPIVLQRRHHNRSDILPFYRAADLCMVTSLHDGMNLVAKEFVASRSSDDGALILSRFTGAARDLRDALLVNPYDVEQTAEAIRYALAMPAEERARRMGAMRAAVRDRNVYYWAGRLIESLAKARVQPRPHHERPLV